MDPPRNSEIVLRLKRCERLLTGSSQTFVSDGSWMVTKDTAELNTTATVRSSQGAGDYVEYYSAPDARSLAGWDQTGYRYSSTWQPAVVMGAAALRGISSGWMFNPGAFGGVMVKVGQAGRPRRKGVKPAV